MCKERIKHVKVKYADYKEAQKPKKNDQRKKKEEEGEEVDVTGKKTTVKDDDAVSWTNRTNFIDICINCNFQSRLMTLDRISKNTFKY